MKKFLIKLISVGCCLLCCSSYAKQKNALSLEEIAQKNGKLSKEEVQLILKTAEGNDPEYQLIAGILYATGTNVDADINKAIKWWKKSAKGKNPVAQRLLGIEYSTGEHIPQDYKKSFNLYKEASAKGDLYATCNLGIMYELGQYVAPNLEKAVEYYEKAANAGMTLAQIMLADMYFSGKGTKMNLKKATELYKKALSSKDIYSINAEQIAGAYITLVRIYEQADDHGGITRTDAIDYLKKAFNLGEYEAIRALALVANELDTDNMNWLYQNALKYPDNSHCLFALGVSYELGKGTPKNLKSAFKCYKKSAELGNIWGMHYLAYAYSKGLGTKQNQKEGLQWEIKAAELIPQAQYNVGISYLHGIGTKQNIKEAKKWLKLASKNSYSEADKILKEIDKKHKK